MSKMKKIIYGAGIVLLMLLDTSCNKWLDLSPQDGITRQEYWKTKEDIKSAIIGCYSSLITSPVGVSDRTVTEYLFTWGEIRADMISASPIATVDDKNIMEVNIVASNPLTKWAALYRTINYCNTVLDYAPEVKKSDPTLTDEQLNAYLGEALTLRSLMYFYLVRTFRDVPFKVTSTSKDTDIQELGTTPASVILDQLVADLKTADLAVPVTYNSTIATDKGRITKVAVETLLAEVYLWMEQYDNCIQECNKVIDYSTANPTKLSLINGSNAWWNLVYFNGSSRETIFEFANMPSTNNPFYSILVGSQKRFIASPSLVESVFIPDDMDLSNRDYRGDDVSFSSTSSTITKYGVENPSYVNWQVYRYSDVLLLKAEALAVKGQGAEAIEIVSNLRSTRHAITTTAQNPDPSDVAGICDYILAERSREFAFEGKRWYDLLRNAKRNNYERIDLLLNMVAGTVPSNLQQTAMNKFKDVNSHYLPINEADIFADTKLIQNPFYK